MSTESEQDAIEKILQNFKFELVYAYMKMVGWTYFDSPDTPTKQTLEATARDLLERVRKEHGNSILTGGFEAYYNTVEMEGNNVLGLRFIPLEQKEYL